jgi:1-deoxy-D-xylulose-5-phosphate synthase
MGMAQAAKINNEPNRNFIAVVGDGALTGGMSYEALNNILDSDLNITIILNDNQIGIDPNTGALNQHLTILL